MNDRLSLFTYVNVRNLCYNTQLLQLNIKFKSILPKTYPSFFKWLCILLDTVCFTVSFDYHFYNICKQPLFYNKSISFDDSCYEVEPISNFCEAGITIVEDLIDIKNKCYISANILSSKVKINSMRIASKLFSKIHFISSTCVERFYQTLI